MIRAEVTDPTGENPAVFTVPAQDPWAQLLEDQFTHTTWTAVTVLHRDGSTTRYTAKETT